MGELQLTRRAALAALAMAAVSAAVTAAEAQPSGVRFREIRVDVSPLREKVQDEEGRWVAAVLPGYLRQSFAKYLAPGDRSAGVLVARIDDVSLGASQTNMSRFPLAADAHDSIEGVGLVLDGRGRVAQSYPLFCALGADSLPNSPYQTDIRRRRAETLARSFAQWLPGKMGL
ncbi:MAG: hypothetical protein ABSF67_11435 [Roseiarcus sp.]|jgi:hypothetical protein